MHQRQVRRGHEQQVLRTVSPVSVRYSNRHAEQVRQGPWEADGPREADETGVLGLLAQECRSGRRGVLAANAQTRSVHGAVRVHSLTASSGRDGAEECCDWWSGESCNRPGAGGVGWRGPPSLGVASISQVHLRDLLEMPRALNGGVCSTASTLGMAWRGAGSLDPGGMRDRRGLSARWCLNSRRARSRQTLTTGLPPGSRVWRQALGLRSQSDNGAWRSRSTYTVGVRTACCAGSPSRGSASAGYGLPAILLAIPCRAGLPVTRPSRRELPPGAGRPDDEPASVCGAGSVAAGGELLLG